MKVTKVNPKSYLSSKIMALSVKCLVGIAYYWHIGMFEDEHWLRDKPWRIDDLSSVYKQLTSINHDMRFFRYYDTLAVLCNIIDLIKEAMDNNEEVLIYRD